MEGGKSVRVRGCFAPSVRATSESCLATVRSTELVGVIRGYCGRIPFCGRGFSRVNLLPNSVGSVTSVAGLPFAVGRSLHSGCPFNLFTIPGRGLMQIRTSSKAANGRAIMNCAGRSVSV